MKDRHYIVKKADEMVYDADFLSTTSYANRSVPVAPMRVSASLSTSLSDSCAHKAT